MQSFEKSIYSIAGTAPYLNLSAVWHKEIIQPNMLGHKKNMASFQISVDENVPFICTNGIFVSLTLSLQSAIADFQWGMPVH